jgi:hypothetical protein
MKRAWLALAAAAVLLLTNLVALGGVWWNRQGPPEAELALSERELTLPPYWRPLVDREDSGLALQLDVRVASVDDDSQPGRWALYGSYNREAAWLDEAKLRALGFDLPHADGEAPPSERWHRELPRSAFIALELDGPAYRRHLQQAEAWAAWVRSASDEDIAKTLFTPRPSEDDITTRLREARDRDSRLYAIDADRDPAALRARHPDRARVAIVGAKIRAYYGSVQVGQPNRWRGSIDEIDVTYLHVSTRWRSLIDQFVERRDEHGNPPRYTARIAWGRKHEPWIVDLQAQVLAAP